MTTRELVSIGPIGADEGPLKYYLRLPIPRVSVRIGVANTLNQERGIVLFTSTLPCTYTNVKAVPPAWSC
jgi:hypothetical protein